METLCFKLYLSVRMSVCRSINLGNLWKLTDSMKVLIWYIWGSNKPNKTKLRHKKYKIPKKIAKSKKNRKKKCEIAIAAKIWMCPFWWGRRLIYMYMPYIEEMPQNACNKVSKILYLHFQKKSCFTNYKKKTRLLYNTNVSICGFWFWCNFEEFISAFSISKLDCLTLL